MNRHTILSYLPSLQGLSPRKAILSVLAGFAATMAAAYMLWLVFRFVAFTLALVNASAIEVVRVYQAQLPIVQLLLILLTARIIWQLLVRAGFIRQAQVAYARVQPVRVYSAHTRSRTTNAYSPDKSSLYCFHFSARRCGPEAVFYGG